jgi:hypothetical protein
MSLVFLGIFYSVSGCDALLCVPQDPECYITPDPAAPVIVQWGITPCINMCEWPLPCFAAIDAAYQAGFIRFTAANPGSGGGDDSSCTDAECAWLASVVFLCVLCYLICAIGF